VRDDLLADDIYKPLARYLIVAHKGIKNVLTHLLAIILINGVLIDLTNRHVSLLVINKSDCQSLERLRHALATFLLKVSIEVVIERSGSASTLDGEEETSMAHSSAVSIAQLVQKEDIPQLVSDLLFWTQLSEELRNVFMNKRNCFARVREHKRLPFLRLLFENRSKNCPTKLETVGQLGKMKILEALTVPSSGPRLVSNTSSIWVKIGPFKGLGHW
jgi:hypothetical protein